MNTFDIREWALETGRARAEENGDRSQAWLLSPVDTWERNPFYRGPANPRHPEDDYEYTDADGAVRTSIRRPAYVVVSHLSKNVAAYIALTDMAIRSDTSESAKGTLLRYSEHVLSTFTSAELSELFVKLHGARPIDSIDPNDIQF